jgi:hypothetical protein
MGPAGQSVAKPLACAPMAPTFELVIIAHSP